MWYVFSFFVVALFSNDMRSQTILPKMEEPIDSLHQIDFATTRIALHYGKWGTH